MKYANYILFCLLFSFCLLSFSSCKAKKNLQKSETVQQSAQRIESSTDKSIATKEAGSKISIETNQNIREFNRTTHFDSTGNVSSVSETWRETGSSELALQNDSSRDISMTNNKDSATTVETRHTTSQEKTDTKTDSRPVQGIEWLWIILGIGLIAAIAISILIRKLK